MVGWILLSYDLATCHILALWSFSLRHRMVYCAVRLQPAEYPCIDSSPKDAKQDRKSSKPCESSFRHGTRSTSSTSSRGGLSRSVAFRCGRCILTAALGWTGRLSRRALRNRHRRRRAHNSRAAALLIGNRTDNFHRRATRHGRVGSRGTSELEPITSRRNANTAHKCIRPAHSQHMACNARGAIDCNRCVDPAVRYCEGCDFGDGR